MKVLLQWRTPQRGWTPSAAKYRSRATITVLEGSSNATYLFLRFIYARIQIVTFPLSLSCARKVAEKPLSFSMLPGAANRFVHQAFPSGCRAAIVAAVILHRTDAAEKRHSLNTFLVPRIHVILMKPDSLSFSVLFISVAPNVSFLFNEMLIFNIYQP